MPNEEKSVLSELIEDEKQYFDDSQGGDAQEETTEESQAQAPKKGQAKQAQSQDAEEEGEQDQDSDEEVTISAELVKAYGLPREFVGKPIKAIFDSYKNLRTEYQKVTQLKNTKQSEEKLEERQKPKPTLADRLNDLPDTLDPDYNKALLNLIAESQKDAVESVLEKLQPMLKPAQDMVKETRMQKILSEIESQLPEDVDVDELLQEFKNENEDDFEILTQVYSRNPMRLVKDVLNFHKLRSLEGNEGKKSRKKADLKEVIEDSADAVRNAARLLNQAKGKKAIDLNSYKKTGYEKPKSLIADLIETEEEIFNSTSY